MERLPTSLAVHLWRGGARAVTMPHQRWAASLSSAAVRRGPAAGCRAGRGRAPSWPRTPRPLTAPHVSA